MIKYAKIINDDTFECYIFLGEDINWALSQGYLQQDVEQSEVDGNWYLKEHCPHYTPEEKEAIEKERIGNLQCTKRVFVLMLERLGFDYFEQIEPAINSDRQAKLEWELCIELQRKNPLLDKLASEFGVTSEQLDNLFKFANGEITQEEFLGE